MVVGSVGLMARLVFTSPFLSPAVGISRMGMGAHWSSCPVDDSTSVKPSSHMQIPACRGQRRFIYDLSWSDSTVLGGMLNKLTWKWINSWGVFRRVLAGMAAWPTCYCLKTGLTAAPRPPRVDISHSFTVNQDKSTSFQTNRTISELFVTCRSLIPIYRIFC